MLLFLFINSKHGPQFRCSSYIYAEKKYLWMSNWHCQWSDHDIEPSSVFCSGTWFCLSIVGDVCCLSTTQVLLLLLLFTQLLLSDPAAAATKLHLNKTFVFSVLFHSPPSGFDCTKCLNLKLCAGWKLYLSFPFWKVRSWFILIWNGNFLHYVLCFNICNAFISALLQGITPTLWGASAS